MALKGDRKITDGFDISFFMNETGEKGEVLVFSTGGSGAAMDDANAVVTTPGTVSGCRPAGVLLNDVVNLDLTRQHVNQHKDEVQLGGKVAMVRHGVILTNVIHTGLGACTENGVLVPALAIGAPAYVGKGAITSGGTTQGWLTTAPPLDHRWEGVGTTVTGPNGMDVNTLYHIGTFLSLKDSDGYAKVEVNIP